MDKNMQEYGAILSSTHNRLIIGLILVGLGAGLIAYSYIFVKK